MFALLVQLARLLWTAYVLRKAPEVLDITSGINGEPLPIATAGTLLRWRLSHPAPPLALAGELQRLLDARLRHVDRRTVRVAAALLSPADVASPGHTWSQPTVLRWKKGCWPCAD